MERLIEAAARTTLVLEDPGGRSLYVMKLLEKTPEDRYQTAAGPSRRT